MTIEELKNKIESLRNQLQLKQENVFKEEQGLYGAVAIKCSDYIGVLNSIEATTTEETIEKDNGIIDIIEQEISLDYKGFISSENAQLDTFDFLVKYRGKENEEEEVIEEENIPVEKETIEEAVSEIIDPIQPENVAMENPVVEEPITTEAIPEQPANLDILNELSSLDPVEETVAAPEVAIPVQEVVTAPVINDATSAIDAGAAGEVNVESAIAEETITTENPEMTEENMFEQQLNEFMASTAGMVVPNPVELNNTEVPVQEVVAPVQEVTAPAQEVVAPVQEVTAPAQEVVAPVQEVTVPVQEVTAPTQEVVAPAQEVVAPVQEVPQVNIEDLLNSVQNTLNGLTPVEEAPIQGPTL